MNRNGIKIAVDNGYIEWKKHALERMLERGTSRDNVKKTLLSGEIIEDYPDDRPYPSALFLGWTDKEPLHVVVAFDVKSFYCFVITAYRPDLAHFENDYKTRRYHD